MLHNPLGLSKSLRLFPGGGGCGSGREGLGVVFVTVGRRLYGRQGFKRSKCTTNRCRRAFTFWMRYITFEIRRTTRKVIALLPGTMSGECRHTSIPDLKCLPGDLRFLDFFVRDDRTSSPGVSSSTPAPAITIPPQG